MKVNKHQPSRKIFIRQSAKFACKHPSPIACFKNFEKYDNNERAMCNGTAFPVISNQKANSYLKEIFEKCQ